MERESIGRRSRYPSASLCNHHTQPCFPAFFPVMKAGQLGTEEGGNSARIPVKTPSVIKRPRLGMKPAATQGRAKSQVAPSRAMTITLVWALFTLTLILPHFI